MNPKTKKIAIVIGLIVVMILCFPLGKFLIEKVRAFPNSILSFSPATRLVGANQDFTLDARIDPRTNQVTTISVRVTFDPAKFRLDGISTTGSPFSVTLLAASINNTTGTAAIDVGIPPANPPVPVTTLSKIATFSFHSLAAATNSPIAFTSSSMAAALGESTDVLTERNPSLVTVDATAPSGGSITYINGYRNALSVALTASDGTDPVAGINASSRIVRRRSATLNGTTCGTYGSWGTISPTGTYPNFTDSAVLNGSCYQYQYLVSDSVGNQATYTGSSTAKVDTSAPSVAQVTAVPNLTNDATPNYTFSSTEAGTIAYGGDCSSSTSAAVSGNNTVTFNTLSSAAHSNCTIRVTDAAGNQSSVLNVNSFTVDAVAPAITSITPAANGSINSITAANGGSDVSYTLSEAIQSGTIVFTRTSGTADASSPRTCALRGTALNSGAHNNLNLADTTNGCAAAQSLVSGTIYTLVLSATDLAGNSAAQISRTGITFDTAAPTIPAVNSTKANGAYSAGAVIDIVVTFSEAVTSTGNVTVTLDTGRNCSFTVSNAATGTCNYTVQTGDSSADLTTTAISGTIADRAGNALINFSPVTNLGANKNLVISAALPILAQVTAAPSIASDTTPTYTFSSSRAGTISYAGDCSSGATAAVAGNNTVTFNALSVGTHANCTVTVTDSSGNASLPLGVSSFSVTYPADFDANRAINLFDYNILASNYGNTSCGNAADANGDCTVNLFDYNLLVQDYGRSF